MSLQISQPPKTVGSLSGPISLPQDHLKELPLAAQAALGLQSEKVSTNGPGGWEDGRDGLGGGGGGEKIHPI